MCARGVVTGCFERDRRDRGGRRVGDRVVDVQRRRRGRRGMCAAGQQGALDARRVGELQRVLVRLDELRAQVLEAVTVALVLHGE